MKKNLLLALCSIAFMNSLNAQQYAWVQRADLANTPRYAQAYFTIGNKGYAGTGITHVGSTYTYHQDFWEYDPATDVWTQKANFAGPQRYGASGFSVGNKGYITLGWVPQLDDLWQYDPVANSWTQKTNFGGSARYIASQFVIDNFVYVGTGYAPYSTDFWRYDFQTDSWTQVADIGGYGRCAARGFTLNNFGYVVNGGIQFVAYTKDLWRYDPVSNSWTQMANFPGAERSSPAAFTMNGKAFVGSGSDGFNLFDDFYCYDGVTDSWSPIAVFPGLGRLEQISFSFPNRGFVGTGCSDNYPGGNDLTELWELVDITGVNEMTSADFSVTPTVNDNNVTFNFSKAPGQNYAVSIFDAAGKMIVKQEFSKNETRVSVSLHNAAAGIYIYTITADNNIKSGKFNF
ncbi:MAG TPA: kelch repeat-containing protein [Bacteroidia bacterium]|nr:kelch repeat-containing protein [Bacteroidia bacterium]